ncbi:DCC1-like thiol-disulfide oxidoreductase family protein [Sorangium sp. So ce854]|uniref:DCC1-like thiol-disulfide oxidoreductase family protein n=1 Tax=Sorangium sp. So ce854 TaxID=3133322 RepID=UPI003F628FF0
MKSLRDHFLRIDARSLGLFRITFALALIADLLGRWQWVRDFYSNEGVLPNHNHLFNLRGKQQVFSLFHAFSTVGEAHFAFSLALVVYALFLVGFRTRVFHVLALLALVSLTSRNILLENAGNYAAIAILAFTAFLPCGSRFSIDSLRASLSLRDELRDAELNDRSRAPDADIEAERLPGWSPTSLAALAVLLQLALIYLCTALQQRGPAWRDGTAFYYALHVDRWASDAGAWLRDAVPLGTLSGLTFATWGMQLAIPALLFIPGFPALFRWTRGLAAALMAAHGLILGIFFDFGLFGWALAAAAPLVVPGELWDAYERSWNERRARTLVYDVDCGLCLMLCRLIKRLDLRGHVAFQGNGALDDLLVRNQTGATERVPMPKEVTAELVEQTVLAIDRNGRVYRKGAAVTEGLLALPFGWLALPLKLPGISHVLDVLYEVVATRRHHISVLLGKQACGIPLFDESHADGDDEGAAPGRPAPAVRTARLALGALREAAVLVVLAAMLAQTARENPLPGAGAIPQGPVLAGVASWPRMLARWDVMAPEPPRSNALFVIDGQTRASQPIDPLTGEEPRLEPAGQQGTRLGQLWTDYLDRIRRPEWVDFQRAFRDYVAKGGPLSADGKREAALSGFDAYWVSAPIPAPGEAASGEVARDKVFSHSRGGTGRLVDGVPTLPSGRLRPNKPNKPN